MLVMKGGFGWRCGVLFVAHIIVLLFRGEILIFGFVV